MALQIPAPQVLFQQERGLHQYADLFPTEVALRLLILKFRRTVLEQVLSRLQAPRRERTVESVGPVALAEVEASLLAALQE